MRSMKKAVLAVCVTAALLCGLVSPAFGWSVPTTVRSEELLSPDGEVWIALNGMNYGSMLEAGERTDAIYSKDGLLWFTMEGLMYYHGFYSAPDPSDPIWTTGTLNASCISPDGGTVWIATPIGQGWMTWSDYLYAHPAPDPNAEQVLYVSYRGGVYTTTQMPYSMGPVRVLTGGYNYYPFDTGDLLLTVDALNCPYVQISAASITNPIVEGTWTTCVTTEMFMSAVGGYFSMPSASPQNCLKMPCGISFDPRGGNCVTLDNYANGAMTFTEQGFPTLINSGMFYLVRIRAMRDCDLCLSGGFLGNGGQQNPSVYAFTDLYDFYNDLVQPDPAEPADTISVFAQNGMAYRPLHLNTQQVSIQDINGNCVIDEEELAGLSDSAFLGQTVQPCGIAMNGQTIHLTADREYSLPIFVWAEGQSPNYAGSMAYSEPVRFELNFHEPYRMHYEAPPLRYTVKEDDSACITYFDDTYLTQYADGVAGDRSGIGCVFDPDNGMLTLPDAIDGHPVTEIGDNAFLAATDLPYLNPSTPRLRQLVVPDSVEYVDLNVFGDGLERLHLPVNAHFYSQTFYARSSDLTICSTGSGRAQQDAVQYSISYTLCSGHAAGVLTLHAPTDPVYTGDSLQVSVELTENPGLIGMLLHVNYDSNVLTLTNVQPSGMFASGEVNCSVLTASPFNLTWEDGAADTHYETGTILTLGFTVKETAAAGNTAVTLTYDADSTLNKQLDEVPLRITGDAVLTIVRHTPGDSDGDGEVSLKDATRIARFLVGGWDETIDARNADVNGDGVVNLKDVILIRRYVAGGWGVVLR